MKSSKRSWKKYTLLYSLKKKVYKMEYNNVQELHQDRYVHKHATFSKETKRDWKKQFVDDWNLSQIEKISSANASSGYSVNSVELTQQPKWRSKSFLVKCYGIAFQLLLACVFFFFYFI